MLLCGALCIAVHNVGLRSYPNGPFSNELDELG